jgi:hypothetical protein
MDKSPLTLIELSSVRNGRSQSGDIVAYYEHRMSSSGTTEALLVSFLKDNSTEVNGQTEVNETSLNASIEYANGFIRCSMKEQGNIPELWDMFWQLLSQLKNA